MDHDELEQAPVSALQAPQSPTPSLHKQSNNDIWKMMKKGIYSAKARSVTGSKNTKESIKIMQAKQKVLDRKKAFGVEFLDLIEGDAAKEVLEACVDSAMGDIGKLQEKMNRWAAKIDTNNERLQQKLHKKKAGQMPEDGNDESDEEEEEEELVEEKDSDSSDDELVEGEPEQFEVEYDNDSVSQLSSNGTSVTGSITDQSKDGSQQSQRNVVQVTMALEEEEEVEQVQEKTVEAPEYEELEAPEDELMAEALAEKQDDDAASACSLQVLAPDAPSFDEGSDSANHSYHRYAIEGDDGQVEVTGLSFHFPSIAIAEEAMALASADTSAHTSDHPSDEMLPSLSEHGLRVVEEEEEVEEDKSFTEASDIEASDVLSSSGESFHEALEALRKIVMNKEERAHKEEEEETARPSSEEDYDGDEEATQVTSNSQTSSQRSLVGEGLVPTEEVTVEGTPPANDDNQDWQAQHHPPHWNTATDMESLD